MATYVLVGGAWIGGWAWQAVARALRARGHEVYPATLTGLGERAHLGRPETDLETHIADVVNLMAYEDLAEVVLVGHSYAGFVVTGVADRAGELLSEGGACSLVFTPKLNEWMGRVSVDLVVADLQPGPRARLE